MASESSQPTATGVLSFLGMTTVLFLVTIIAIGLLRVSGTGGETLEQRRAAGRIAVRNKLEMEAQEKLHSEGWVDKAKGTVHVAIGDSIPLTVAELRSKKPAPSQVKVEPPLPVIVPDPNSKEPPLPAMPSAPSGAHTIRFASLATPEPAAPAATPAPAAKSPAAAPAPPTPAPAPAAPAPAPAPAPPALESKPAPPPAAPAPAAEPAAPARPPLINPTENPAPTK